MISASACIAPEYQIKSDPLHIHTCTHAHTYTHLNWTCKSVTSLVGNFLARVCRNFFRAFWGDVFSPLKSDVVPLNTVYQAYFFQI